MSAKHTQGRLQQGFLLDTPITRRWTQAEREQTERHERRMLFVGFTPLDEGRSRVRVAVCESDEYARRLVACWNLCETVPTENIEELSAFGLFRVLAQTELYKMQRDELLAALEDAVSVCRSVSISRDRRIVRDGCTLYAQTEEWCKWAEEEVGPKLIAAIAKVKGGAA